MRNRKVSQPVTYFSEPVKRTESVNSVDSDRMLGKSAELQREATPVTSPVGQRTRTQKQIVKVRRPKVKKAPIYEATHNKGLPQELADMLDATGKSSNYL